MNGEIKKLFEAWTMDHTFMEPEVEDKWGELIEYLEGECSETNGEEIFDCVLDICDLLEERAFREGFVLAFKLWIEVYKV